MIAPLAAAVRDIPTRLRWALFVLAPAGGVALALMVPQTRFVAASMAGLVGYLALAELWETRTPATWRTRLDVHAHHSLVTARAIILGAVACWLIVVLLTGPFIPAPVLGAANVSVVLAAIGAWTPHHLTDATVGGDIEAVESTSGPNRR